MTLPTKKDIILAGIFIVLGGLFIITQPDYLPSGWYLLLFGIVAYLFPGPQLHSRFKRTEQQQQQLREKVIAASHKPLAWWATPLPWGLLLILMLIVFLVLA
ncbi:hypothetical protein [Arsukibacterium sp.]|uniref:hypothetical protein n=1 Tax=Arsukibacterium sp. TaxID=1977258 RepID=UPI002FD9EF44